MESSRFWDAVEVLWRDPGVQTCFELLRREGSMVDNAAYFFDRAGDLRRPGYLPTDRDILRCYEPTAGIREANIKFDKTSFRLIEVF